ncbi:MAG: lipoprotein 17-related variable surface protein [Treponema sp.]
MKLKLFTLCACALILAGCSVDSGADTGYKPTPQETINTEVDKVTLDVPAKAAITAEALTEEKIVAAGYDNSLYTIRYEITADNASRSATVKFRLEKGTLHSKFRTLKISGFKMPNPTPTPQETINAEVDKVMLDVPTKATITANQLTADKITATGYAASTYTIKYVKIEGNAAAKSAEVTFRLENGSIHSKTRTVTITGFMPLAETYPIAESDLLTVFNLTRGTQSASEAAKKIAAGAHKTVDGYTFTEVSAQRYDDEAGTFTVKVKGTKDRKPFDKEITVTGFMHPYASPLQSLVKCNFDLNPAIEENWSLDTYISRVNAAASAYLQFEAMLANGKTVTLGETVQYKLEAQVSKDNDGLKASPKYSLKYQKLTAGGAETTDVKPYTIGTALTQNRVYFTEDDVFKYVLTKTGDDFVKVSSDEFASSFYALAHASGTTPDGLLDMTKIQKYVDLYKTKDANEHLQVKISAGVYNPKNGGISANDTNGELTLQYCIATDTELEKQANGQSAKITAKSEEITKSGFKKADKETLKNLFMFKIIRSGSSGDAKKEWQKYNFPGGNSGWPLVKQNGSGYETKSFPSMTDKPFRLTINDADDPTEIFALSSKSGLSEISSGKYILITYLFLTKKMGDDKLTAAFTLVDGNTVYVEYSPSF